MPSATLRGLVKIARQLAAAIAGRPTVVAGVSTRNITRQIAASARRRFASGAFGRSGSQFEQLLQIAKGPQRLFAFLHFLELRLLLAYKAAVGSFHSWETPQ